MDAQLTELNGRLADVQKELVEMTAQRNKAQAETADVARRLADSESQAAQLSRLRVALAQQVMFGVLLSTSDVYIVGPMVAFDNLC